MSETYSSCNTGDSRKRKMKLQSPVRIKELKNLKKSKKMKIIKFREFLLNVRIYKI